MIEQGRARAFLRLCRPQFLVPGFLLYVLGYLLAGVGGAPLDPGTFSLGYLVFFLAHFSLTFSNDYFDREADALNTPTPLSGGSGSLNLYPDMASTALRVSWLLISLSIITAIVFQLAYGPAWYFLPVVLLGNLVGYYYSAPPLRLAYRGLGEISTMLAAGLLMPGMGYLSATGRLDMDFLRLTPAFLTYGAFFILSVEMPDLDADRAGGKRNLLVRYGIKPGMRAAFASVALGTLLWAVLWVLDQNHPLGYDVILVISLVPLLAGLAGIGSKMTGRSRAVTQAKMNFASLLAFLIMLNAHLALSL